MVWFKVFGVMAAVAAWSQKALADGAIDLQEAGELVKTVCDALGVKVEIKLPPA